MKSIAIRIILCVAMFLSGFHVNAQVKEFEKYADTKNVTYVYVSKFMLQMAGKAATPSVPGMNIRGIMNKLTGIQIITSEEKSAATRLKNDTQAIVKQGKYELLMQVDEDDQKVRIYHHDGKKQSAIIMLTDEEDEVVVMVFSGTFTLDDVMKMTK